MSTPEEQVQAQRRAWNALVEGRCYGPLEDRAWRHLIGPTELSGLFKSIESLEAAAHAQDGHEQPSAGTPTDEVDRVRKAAEDAGLSRGSARLFEAYVTQRFPDADEAYLATWARRFAIGRAYAASDGVGRAFLLTLIQTRDGML